MASSSAVSLRSGSRRRPSRGGSRSRPGGAGVRWDRVGRVALLIVLAGVLLLYVGPAVSYVRTWREADAKRTELHLLARENARLLARRRALRQPSSLEREARGLGMVRQGERAFVIEGLPPGD